MRKAGVLLHISSLPSNYGIGTLGKEAYDFVDFLDKAGQKIWQILPIGPTSFGDSPYQALSAFAFNPYFIDLVTLVEDGLIETKDLPKLEKTKRVDYGELFNTRYKILHKAFLNMHSYVEEFLSFVDKEDSWLDDYACFMVLKERQENKCFEFWYDDFKYRNPSSMKWLREKYSDRILEYKFYQFLFFKQWHKLKSYANSKGISIMGDMPIYCAYDSADVWANPKLFELDENLKPINVAGCPPDAFSLDGQLWGNPLYNWELMKEDLMSPRIGVEVKFADNRIAAFRVYVQKAPSGECDEVVGKLSETDVLLEVMDNGLILAARTDCGHAIRCDQVYELQVIVNNSPDTCAERK